MATDVCAVLDISETRIVIERLDQDEWGKIPLIDALGRTQETYILSESGVYAAISRSNKPAAKDFQRWLRKDVVPSIRKYGGTYSMSALKSLKEALRALLQRTALLQKGRNGLGQPMVSRSIWMDII